ncbi:helix-turn-helix domain-containing protein [Kosmotoga olearia]|uniref:Transcriptional regulator, XRE family n=1 Tax=Kosmotoga olearia (strain ATCC BAA-1733 / DSM 21960 / TBF 19.5.1) TaxID=521045 RepID=C5CH39_KOSOT|nr:helix-turn-helix transcriptional regulator [Kosmotoga olearia]ACR80642.1 transcriptional regulator, XRE family [Kosmotoga olearia TBF 19.5.1]
MKKLNELKKMKQKLEKLSEKPELEEYVPSAEEDALEEFILEVIERRAELKISQKKLAKILGTTQSVISRFENMGRKPGYEFIKRISEALGGKLMITLNGDYAVVVPTELRERVDELANKEGLTPKEFLNLLISESLNNWEHRHKKISQEEIII